MMKQSLFFILGCLIAVSVSAQKKNQPADSAAIIPIAADTIVIESGKRVIDIDTYAQRFDPRKALFYAAIFPGAGQVYNRKYWKVPLVYGGFAIGIYSVNFYQDLYVRYKAQLFEIINDRSLTVSSRGYSEAQLRSIVNKSRRERDFWIILNGFWYLIQIVDAHVDAHLKEFELNPQLKVRLEPILQNDILTGRTSGVALIIRF